ncbi:MAG: thrombospondin type 3 repeat-containing protein [Gammaproteobacteria bacterium]
MLSITSPRTGLCFALVLLASGAHAQLNPQGPAPAFGGQTENLGGDEVTGAINTIATHPTDPDIAYIGAVNGGIWKATQLTNFTPEWEEQRAFDASQSIGDIVFDSADATHQTLVAGAGRFSSYGRRGGALTGLLRTTDGGGFWDTIGTDLIGRNVSKLAANGDQIVVAVNFAEPFLCENVGVFRSFDQGASFNLATLVDNGIPRGVSTGLAADPSNPDIIYASVIFADVCDGGQNGIYRSADGGAQFVKVSDAAMDAVTSNDSGLIEIDIASDGRVVVALSEFGRLSGVFFSDDDGATWTGTDLPGTNEPSFVGVHAGGQASIHFSLAIDTSDSNIVYVGGDRQPLTDTGGFPNALGATDFSGRLFRGDLSASSGNQWAPLTHSGTASSSSPHADSRDLALDANGDLIETDDGGVYRRTQPKSVDGDWFSLNGTGSLQVTEAHNMAFDSNAGVLLTGNQDTGTTNQSAPSSLSWFALQNGDGGDVAVDTQTLDAQDQSIRYSSFQFLSAFSRRTFDDQNQLLDFTSVPLTVISGAPFSGQFTTPVILNQIDRQRFILGGSAAAYESLDQGDTISQLAPSVIINGFDGRAAAYGSIGAEDLLFVGVGSSVLRRVNAGDPLVTVFSSPTDGPITAIALDPSDPSEVFITDGSAIFRSSDGGDNFVEITGDINDVPFAPLGRIRALQFVEGPDFDALVAGGDRNIRATNESVSFASWLPLTTLDPNALVYEFDYDATDDRLFVGTLGRGTFSVANVTDAIVFLVDTDGDGVVDDQDNCTLVVNSDQRDTNGDGFGNLCDADLNNDGVINVADLGLLRNVFFSDDADADFDGDGVVNVADLGLLRASFFGAPGPSGIAP